MPKTRYPVFLTAQEREMLHRLAHGEAQSDRMVRRAQILLLSDERRDGGKMSDTRIADKLLVHVNTVLNIRKAFASRGVQAVYILKKETDPPAARELALAQR